MLRHVQTAEGRILVNDAEMKLVDLYPERLAARMGAARKREPVDHFTMADAPTRLDRSGGRSASIRRLMEHSDLPPANTRVRWVPRRKGALASAVLRGQISTADACERYGLTMEELTTWMADFRAGGEKALRTTKKRV